MSISHDRRKLSLSILENTLERNRHDADERQKRINDCVVEDTDCALSMWASDAGAAKLRVQLDLARNNWKAKFKVLHRDGKPVIGRKVETKFGTRWVIDGKFLPCYGAEETGRRASNFAKLGFTWVEMDLDAHVASTCGNFIGAPIFYFPVPDSNDLIVA